MKESMTDPCWCHKQL